MDKIKIFIVSLLILSTIFTRFYKITHDFPYFFDPDERNMAVAISQFKLPPKLSGIPYCLISQIKTVSSNNCNLNPHFFAYGQFPLYFSYFSDQTTKIILNFLPFRSIFANQSVNNNQLLTTDFPSAIYWLRVLSASSSAFTVLVIYLISKILIKSQYNEIFALFAAIFCIFCPGLMQSAHFGTTEAILTFFSSLSVYFSLLLYNALKNNVYSDSLKYSLLLSVSIGLSFASKLTGLIFLISPSLTLFVCLTDILINNRKKILSKAALITLFGLFILSGTILISIIASPYNVLDFSGFKGSVFGYEKDVATGAYDAFYTRQFMQTVPVLFQMEKIFPYALGWPVFILGSLGILLVNFQLIFRLILSIIFKIQNSKLKTQNLRLRFLEIYPAELFWILSIGFWVYFLPNAFLYAKWTRFMTPIMPMFAVFAAYTIYQTHNLLSSTILKSQNSNIKTQNSEVKLYGFKILAVVLSFAFCILTCIPGLAFMSIYAREDSRLTASRWIYNNIPNGSYVLSETANVVDIPLGIDNNLNEIARKYKVISFDFYHMDENETIYEDLFNHLEKADYIFIPSRRIYANHLRFPKKYPRVAKYYYLLFENKLGFKKISEIYSYPSLFFPWNTASSIISFPDEKSEETFTVFDHPVIRVYQKVKKFNKEEYLKMFQSIKI